MLLFLQLRAGAGRGRERGPSEMCFGQLTSLMFEWFLELRAHRVLGVGFFGGIQLDGSSYLFGSGFSWMASSVLVGGEEANQVLW